MLAIFRLYMKDLLVHEELIDKFLMYYLKMANIDGRNM
jgi:hypothetical protein